jgi:hypothetical protein
MLKRWILTACAPVLALALMLTLLPTTASAQTPEFCWKDSYGRGVGTIPPSCNSDRVKQTGMCYTPCRDGYEGTVTMCLRSCPSGYSNWGMTCHIDKALLVPAKVDLCNASTSCPSGYTNAGLLCGLNTPGVPAGWKAAVSGPAGSGLDLSRELYDRGIGLAPSVCDGDKVNSGGLCYPSCKPNFSGIGPVCWGTCPSGWTDCGAGCAENAGQCVKVIGNQVYGVISAAKDIAKLVATLGAAAATKPAENSSAIAKAVADLKKLYEQNKAYLEATMGAATYAAANYQLATAVTPEEMAQASLRIAGLVDPTGLAAATANFVYPKCDKVSPR